MSDKLNINEQVQMILDIANQLRGLFKEDEYQNVIIPMTICRRFVNHGYKMYIRECRQKLGLK